MNAEQNRHVSYEHGAQRETGVRRIPLLEPEGIAFGRPSNYPHDPDGVIECIQLDSKDGFFNAEGGDRIEEQRDIHCNRESDK